MLAIPDSYEIPPPKKTVATDDLKHKSRTLLQSTMSLHSLLLSMRSSDCHVLVSCSSTEIQSQGVCTEYS
jgi:hypothetical protein